MLLAVFAPSLARGIVNDATVAAGSIVVVIWVLWFFLVTLPRSPAWQERKRAKAEARARREAPPPLPAKPAPAAVEAEGGEDGE